MFKELTKVFGETIVYGFTGIASALASVFLVPFYTRVLTPEDYGISALLGTLFAVLAVVANMGMSSAIFWSYFRAKEKERPDIAGTAFISQTVLPLFISLIILLVSDFVSRVLFGHGGNSFLVVLSAIALFFNTGITIPLALLRAEGRPVNFVSINLAKLFSTILFSIILVVVLRLGLVGVFWANLAGAFLGYLMGLGYALPRIKLTFSWYWLKDMLEFGAPMVPAGLAMWAINSSDRYFLNAFTSTADVGIYNVGYKVGMIVTLVAGALQLAYPRFMFSIYNSKPDAKEYFKKINTYFYLLLFTCALPLSIFAKEAVQILTGSAFHSAYIVVPFIAFSYVAFGLYQNFGTGVSVVKKTYLSTFATLIAGGSNLLLNYTLISRLGMIGAAVSTLLSFLILALTELYFSQRVYPIRFEFRRLFVATAVGGVLVYTASVVKFGLLASLGVKALIFLAFLPLLYLFGFFEERELRKLVQMWTIAKKSRFRPKIILDSIRQEMIT